VVPYVTYVKQVAPELLTTVLTSQQGVIRGLALDTVKNYVFTGGFDEGEVAVFDIEKPGKVQQILIIV